MAERRTINLLYEDYANWTGGTYYILNIIRALKLLNDSSKPYINIVHNEKSSTDVIKSIDYPYIRFTKWDIKRSVSKRIANKLMRILFGKRLVGDKLPPGITDNVYPLNSTIELQNLKNSFFWIPDFQDKYLPQFFTEQEILSRNNQYQFIVDSGLGVVFSSRNALNDYNKFYPDNHNKKVVLSFASFIGDKYKVIPMEDLKKKYDIKVPYFIVANQFWAHKNHKIVLEAIYELKQRGFEFKVLFTGKEEDYRNPDYIIQIKQYISDKEIGNHVSLLGFIDRHEQLQLMKHALAIIQPSFFEGWSTVVEDAKAINNYLLVSDIPIHREQCVDNFTLFDPKNANDLSFKMEQLLENPPICKPGNYELEHKKFAENLLSLFFE